MQKSLNSRVRNIAYTLLNNPMKMFKVRPQAAEERKVLHLDFSKRTPVRPPMLQTLDTLQKHFAKN